MPVPSPSPDAAGVVFLLELGGSAIPDTIAVVSLRVVASSGRPAAATVTLLGDPALAASPSFAPGQTVRLAAGPAGPLRPLFAGTLAGLRFAADRAGHLHIVLECTGPAPAPGPADPAPALTLAFGTDLLDCQLDDTARPAGTPFSGRLQLPGTAAVAPGDRVTLAGFGPRFDGPVPVQTVTHEIRAGQWTTTLALGPAPAPVTPPATLRLGRVKQLAPDPQDGVLLLVSVPVADERTAEIWARCLTPYATQRGGGIFHPEIDDQVVLAESPTLDGRPLVLGSLFSGGRLPPETPDPERKLIVTRNGS